MLTIIDGQPPYHAGQRRGRHWLTILKGLSNDDKHGSLMLHAVNVRPEIYLRFTSVDGGTVLESRDADREGKPEAPQSGITDGEVLELGTWNER